MSRTQKATQKVSQKEQAASMRALFTRIARHYDCMNRLMTAGQDVRWRRRVLDLAQLPPGGRLLDVGTGTGDLALEAGRRDPQAWVAGGDLTPAMMRLGRGRPGSECVRWVNLDALDLPFRANTFDAVTAGYLMRNVSDVRRAWRELYRVLRPGGVAVCLDTTPPRPGWQRSMQRVYLKWVLPALGGLVAGDRSAYTYLPESTERFLIAEELSECQKEAGFKEVQFRRLAFDAMAIHWGYK